MLLLNACTSTGGYEPAGQLPAEVEDRVIVNGEVLPLPQEPQIRTESLPGQQTSSPVVSRLLATAEQQRNAGNADAAANALERALRIEPRNAMLWSRLADIRYTQNDFRQAVQLAAKSNTLSGTNSQLRRQNWYLMANAYAALDDNESAQKYRDKLTQ
jgi:tetratricopeptide (TPR) repeat protein